MESFFTRYRNVTVLLVLLMAQVIALAAQVRRPDNATGESLSLMRVWVVHVFVPAEKAVSAVGSGVRNAWRNYIDLRDVRSQNEELKAQLDRLRLEQVSLAQDAGQARRLQALLSFKEKFVSETVPAQVIGTSGSDRSRVLYIDKGSRDGIKADMAVITPKGIVGKVMKAFSGGTAQVLEINDATAGAGVMLERSRLRGVMHGTSSGIPEIMHVMADEKIEIGESVVSSGGDQIYPPGLPIGTVFSTEPDPDGGPFLVVRVKPSANLDKVDGVLVITKVIDKEPAVVQSSRGLRAADILAQRLPTIVPKSPGKAGAEPPPTSALYAKKPAATQPGTGAAGESANKKKTPVGQAASKPTSGPPTSTQATQLKPAVQPAEQKAGTAVESAGKAVNAEPAPKTAAPADTPPPQENPR